MNAKKIMGAVLVALLAAALFVGAGAAATDIGTVTTYTQLQNPASVSYTWTGGNTFFAADGTPISVVDYDGQKYFAVEGDALNKLYSGYGITFKLVAPTAVVSALDTNGVNIIGQTVSAGVANNADFVYTFGTTYTNTKLIFIDADGVKYNAKPTSFSAGKWGVAANLTGATGLVSGAAIQGQTYYFTVAKTDATISAAKDTVNVGNSIVLNVVVPGKTDVKVYYDKDEVTPIPGQYGVIQITDKYVNVTLGIDGATSVAFKADEEGKTTFELTDLSGKPKVDVTIEKGEITAVADEEFFYLGNAIKLSGTTTAGDKLYFYIEGTNFNFQNLDAAYQPADLEVENGKWTIKIDSNKVKTPVSSGQTKGLVTGTYTIIVSTVPYTDVAAAADKKAEAMSEVYGAVAVTMKQPFITDVKAAAVAIQDNKYEITGTAIAAADVNVYIFGTSFFLAKQLVTVDSDDETFTITLDEATTKSMSPGTYFYLIQHPFNDKVFNVWNGSVSGDKYVVPVSGAKEADFYYAATGANNATFIFNAWDRETNYAAQALLDEISGQNIDDIFVQGTFEVAAQKLTINPIPAEVVKGTALTVSGTSNSGEGVEVIVNVLAGKFGATVKGDENAATFLTAKAVTQEDGTFEAKIDTSKLETGNYIVTVELEGTMYDSAAVEIVAAGDEPVTPPADDEPVTPPADDEPVAPETPGFGALAALAGLGAVAVLLLRRE